MANHALVDELIAEEEERDMADKDNSLDPMRGRVKAEAGGAPNPGYAKVSKTGADADADYTRPKPCPDPYNSPNERGKD